MRRYFCGYLCRPFCRPVWGRGLFPALAIALACLAIAPWFWLPQVLAAPRAAPLASSSFTFPGPAPCDTLQGCIHAAAPGDTIEIQTGSYIVSNVTITKALTLRGLGVVASQVQLSANNSGRVMSIDAGAGSSVLLEKLTIRDGNSGAAGAGLRINSGLVTLHQTHVLSNTSTGGVSGGGIRALSPITISNSVLAYNRTLGSSARGGALRARENAPVFISKSLFEHNFADTAGGAIATDNTVRIHDSVFVENEAGTNGGAIRADGPLFLVGDMEFVKNRATTIGGAIYATGPGVEATQGESNATLIVFEGNTAGGNGGAIRALGQVLLLSAPRLIDNVAGGGTSADGGAIYATGNIRIEGGFSSGNRARAGGVIYSGGDVDVIQHNLGPTANSASQDGGCIYAVGTVTLDRANANLCSALRQGGVVFADRVRILGGDSALMQFNFALDGGGVAVANHLLIQATKVYSNSSLNLGGAFIVNDTAQIGGSEFRGNEVDNGPGGVIHASGAVTMVNNVFIGNFAKAAASGEDAGLGGVLFSDPGPIVLQGNTYEDNRAEAAGGAIFAETAVDNTAQLAGETFLNNRATQSGGGAFLLGDAQVTGSRFEGNEGQFGGGLRVEGDMVLGNSVFEHNRATGDGGGLFAGGDHVTVTASSFISNSAALSAGGLWAESSASIGGSNFISNTAGATGGGLNVNGGVGQIANSHFIANTSGPIIVDGSRLGGGAIHNAAGPLTLSGLTVRHNSAEIGGGVRSLGSLHVSASTFEENVARDSGGAVFASGAVSAADNDFLRNRTEGGFNLAGEGGALVSLAGPLMLQDNRYMGNRAARDGGAIYLGGNGSSSATLVRELFSDNEADRDAAIRAQGLVTITHSIFLNNESESAIVHVVGPVDFSQPRQIRILNSLFSGNRCSPECLDPTADVRLEFVNALLVNNTFADSAAAGALGVNLRFDGSATVSNSIFAGYGFSLHRLQAEPTFLSQNHNLFFNAPVSAGVTSGAESISANPLFVNAGNGNYRLQPLSPAIDAGLDTAVPAELTVDLDNQPRFFDGPPDTGNLVDMGAFESRKTAPVASAGGPYAGSEGSAVDLNASGSSADTPTATFSWDCTDDGVFDVIRNSATGANCVYADNGVFTLRLRIVDGDGISATATAQVTIANIAPTVTAPPDQSTTAGLARNFSVGAFNDPGPDAPWQVVVDWGDDNAPTGFRRNATGGMGTQEHTYTSPGTKTVTVSVTDKDNATGTASFSITVLAPPAPADDTVTTPFNTAVDIPVLANDDLSQGTILVAAGAPARGTATIQGETIRYTPNAGFAGQDSFLYTVRDVHNVEASALVRVTVNGQGTGEDDPDDPDPDTPDPDDPNPAPDDPNDPGNPSDPDNPNPDEPSPNDPDDPNPDDPNPDDPNPDDPNPDDPDGEPNPQPGATLYLPQVVR